MNSVYTNSYKKISLYILNLINNFNEDIKFMDGIVDELLMVEKLNRNTDFLKFIVQLNESRYCSFKCQGYIECLTMTDYYVPPILCILMDELKLLINHYSKASNYLLDISLKFSTLENDDFEKLVNQIKSSAIFLNSIAELMKLYNLDC